MAGAQVCAAAPQFSKGTSEEQDSASRMLDGALVTRAGCERTRRVHFASSIPAMFGLCQGCGELICDLPEPTSEVWGDIAGAFGCAHCNVSKDDGFSTYTRKKHKTLKRKLKNQCVKSTGVHPAVNFIMYHAPSFQSWKGSTFKESEPLPGPSRSARRAKELRGEQRWVPPKARCDSQVSSIWRALCR